jgi:hypothetical protein
MVPNLSPCPFPAESDTEWTISITVHDPSVDSEAQGGDGLTASEPDRPPGRWGKAATPDVSLSECPLFRCAASPCVAHGGPAAWAARARTGAGLQRVPLPTGAATGSLVTGWSGHWQVGFSAKI